MPKSATRSQINIRVTPEVLAQIETLAQAWGPVAPLSDSNVIREALRRAYQAEKKSKKSAKSVLDGA